MISQLVTGLFLWLVFVSSVASEQFSLELKEAGLEVPVTTFGEGNTRLLWIPGELSVSEDRMIDTATAFIFSDFEIWLADLHAAYFIPSNRSSNLQMPPTDIAELILASAPNDNQSAFFIVSSGRGAALSLMAWQLLDRFDVKNKPDGIILISPNFLAATPDPGQTAQYLELVDQVQAPIYILQPEDSGKRWYIGAIAERLNAAGSQVFLQLLPNVADNFHIHPEARPHEIRLAQDLPTIFKRATAALLSLPPSQNKPPPVINTQNTRQWRVTPSNDMPTMVNLGNIPNLVLVDTDNLTQRLSDQRGKVVLLNFWATWCPPCIKEIPALNRLDASITDNDFVLLSVDIAESPQKVADFLRRIPADYPVLLDPTGSAVKPWKLRAFPTTFIIDRKGKIRYSYFGGLEWDKPEIQSLIHNLLIEKPQTIQPWVMSIPSALPN